MKTPQQIRQHLQEVERELVRACQTHTMNETLCRDYVRACRDVESLDLNEAEYRLPSSRAEVARG